MKNLIIGLSFIISIVALAMCLYNSSVSKNAYIDTVKLYSEFQLTKELNENLETVMKTRKKMLDSLYTLLTVQTESIRSSSAKDEIKINEIRHLEENLYLKQQQFEKENNQLSADYSAKIWGQLNQYVQDYGKNNGYRLLFGANGQGNIMYGNKDIDVTEELISYSNNRFNDKVKK